LSQVGEPVSPITQQDISDGVPVSLTSQQENSFGMSVLSPLMIDIKNTLLANQSDFC